MLCGMKKSHAPFWNESRIKMNLYLSPSFLRTTRRLLIWTPRLRNSILKSALSSTMTRKFWIADTVHKLLVLEILAWHLNVKRVVCLKYGLESFWSGTGIPRTKPVWDKNREFRKQHERSFSATKMELKLRCMANIILYIKACSKPMLEWGRVVTLETR